MRNLFATDLAIRQAIMPTAAPACYIAALTVKTMVITLINVADLNSSLQEGLLP